MKASLDKTWSLTIYNASSTPTQLTVMSLGKPIFVPLKNAYQGWTYYVFRARVTGEEIRSPGELVDRAADQPSTPRATT